MKIYNTMTKIKETVGAISPSEKADNAEIINIYACGPTVYDRFHIGNARQLCVFDVLRRYLKYRGFKIKYVQNFTDVDDKIIKRANELGVSASEVSENAIKDYFTDAQGLNIIEADIHPKVTENMGIIIDIIQTLIDKGYAYKAGVADSSLRDVYFCAEKFREYGKLSKMPLDELQAGASERVSENEYKKAPMDFALWKAAKEGEPYWESPFGKGRPGWHIECSAMVREYLGDTIDIHGGGADLIFPHHENEIAQSEAATGKPLASIWMHNEMINVDNKKMAKSRGNFFLVRDVAGAYGYEPIRFMLLAAHYRSKMNYTEEVMKSAQNAVERLYNCENTIKRLLAGAKISADGVSQAVAEIMNSHKKRFIEVMDDDLNTADGIAVIFELVREINKITALDDASKDDIAALYDVLKELSGVLGLLYGNQSEEIPQEILELQKKREEARKDKNFVLADQIREKITESGYTVEETRQGTVIRKNV